MIKYHINQETGLHARCRAEKKPCPVGGEHYATVAEAIKASEELLNNRMGNGLGSTTRLAVLSEKLLGKVEPTFDEGQQLKELALKRAIYEDYKNASLELENELKEQRDAVRGGLEDKEVLLPLYEKVREAHKLERNARNEWKLSRLPVAHLLTPEKKPAPYIKTRGVKSYSDFVKGARMKVQLDGSENYLEQDRLVSELASWRDISMDDARTIISGYSAATGMSRDEYMVAEFQKGGPQAWTRDRVFIDLETTGLDPYHDEIIEIGIAHVKAGSGEIATKTSVFDMESADARDKLKRVSDDVHGITPAEMAGSRKFTDPVVQKELSKLLNDPNVVIVAHNDNFEQAFLSEHLDGYWAAHDVKAGDPLCASQDTMWLSKFLVHDTPNNKLSSLVEGTGGVYENAHRALPDTRMTYDAVMALSRGLSKTAPGVRPTKADRI